MPPRHARYRCSLPLAAALRHDACVYSESPMSRSPASLRDDACRSPRAREINRDICGVGSAHATQYLCHEVSAHAMRRVMQRAGNIRYGDTYLHMPRPPSLCQSPMTCAISTFMPRLKCGRMAMSHDEWRTSAGAATSTRYVTHDVEFHVTVRDECCRSRTYTTFATDRPA